MRSEPLNLLKHLLQTLIARKEHLSHISTINALLGHSVCGNDLRAYKDLSVWERLERGYSFSRVGMI
jgi:hypothetical protein